MSLTDELKGKEVYVEMQLKNSGSIGSGSVNPNRQTEIYWGTYKGTERFGTSKEVIILENGGFYNKSGFTEKKGTFQINSNRIFLNLEDFISVSEKK